MKSLITKCLVLLLCAFSLQAFSTTEERLQNGRLFVGESVTQGIAIGMNADYVSSSFKMVCHLDNCVKDPYYGDNSVGRINYINITKRDNKVIKAIIIYAGRVVFDGSTNREFLEKLLVDHFGESKPLGLPNFNSSHLWETGKGVVVVLELPMTPDNKNGLPEFAVVLE
ncbi:MAG: hypothetical protein HOD58_06260 [Gammaproteobacteria bacterium]|jgi:hypothetical protein|nr:hypothetical protein [Candidatus Neomarinimicrobiota bacterium]MBT4329512.1 hypothetical protein [Gammaproteobacteria bacterium]MBT5268070.1 hypothetical protein [Candidatus Neomarinimicrobiota bacterium]MBT7082107.1 hypothetical protein [Chloroflexota bacterium]